MKPTTLTGLLLALGLSSSVTDRALAQWSISIALGADRFWGGSVENTPERRSFRPYRPTTFAAALERRSRRVGIALRMRYTKASLGLEGEDAVVAVKDVFAAFSLSPEISYQVATWGQANRLLLHAGPLVEFWSVVDQESRTRVGAQGAVSLSIPVGDGFALTLAAGGALTPSLFTRDELDSTYDLRPLWRRGFAAGLQYRL
jgi:hypothetical protein